MMRYLSPPLFLLCVVLASPTLSEEATVNETISYSKHIAPILQRNCVACHREKQAEGGLSLEAKKTILAGGDSGDFLIGGDPEASLLYLRAIDEDDPMPPEDNTVGAKRLTEQELTLVRNWIRQGASIDDVSAGSSFDWQPIPESIRSSFALDVSPDQRFIAVGRANRVDLINADSGTVRQSLVDHQLEQDGVADVDFIQAVAVSPSGDRIATGGFQSVRIWEREPTTITSPRALASAVGPIAASPDGAEVALVNPVGDVEIWGLANDERRVVVPAKGPVAAIVWRSKSSLVIGLESGEIRSCNTVDGTITAELKLNHPIARLAQSLDGRFIASIGPNGPNGQLSVFEESKPKPLTALAEIKDPTTIRFASASSLIVGTSSGTAIALDVTGDQLIHKLNHGAPITSLSSLDSGSILASGASDGSVKLWNPADGKLLHTLVGDSQSQYRIAYYSSGVKREEAWLNTLNQRTEPLKKELEKEEAALAKVTADRKKAADELDQKTKQRDEVAEQIKQTQGKIAQGKTQVEQAAQAIADNETLLAKYEPQIQKLAAELQPLEKDVTTSVIAVESAKARVQEAMKLLAAAEKAAADKAAMVDKKKAELAAVQQSQKTATEKLAASKKAQQDATKLVEMENGNLKKQQEKLASSETEVQSKKADLAERDQALATAQATRDRAAADLPKHDDRVRAQSNRLSDLKNRLDHYHKVVSSSPAVSCLAFSNDGKQIAIVDVQGNAKTFDVRDGKPLERFEVNDWSSPASDAAACLLPDGRLLLSRRHGGAIAVTTASRWKLARVIGGLDSDLISDRVTAVDFSSNGQAIAIGSGTPSRDGQVMIVAASSGAVLRRFDDVHSDTVLCVRFSPDNRFLATASADKTIRLLDLDRGEVVGALDGHTHHVLSVAWKNDGRLIASGGADGTIKTWDVETGQQKRTIGGFPDEVTAVQFIGETTQVVSACADGQIRIHETNNGGQVRAAGTPGDFLYTTRISNDGNRVFAAGQKGTVHVWQTEGLKNAAQW